MGSLDYTEAVNVALDRLRTTGFYIGHFFANHGPMAAEALAKLGYCDEVDGWVDANIHHRQHGPLPDPTQPITEWQTSLGQRDRGGDWVELFRRELAEAAWRDVLQRWWPRLLPGCAGSLTHGLIRTAHAVRSLRDSAQPTELQMDELARGLALWATTYQPLETGPVDGGNLDAGAVDRALSELTAEYAGHYTSTMPSFPVPLIHTITAPAAMRLLLAEVPADLHALSLRTIAEVNRELFVAFGGQRMVDTPAQPDTERTFSDLAAAAVELGDEHAIKICEAAARENALRPDPRYLGAASAATNLIRQRSGPT
ncbi:questin oxidase family protein [Mycobacterium noviomagense]|uniref:DUF4243 domain-containing protein n=1 Tax=Mycobacterium noviomagense TaxID=459858 RepID=A0A7I7P9Z8_9MYCO|nr:questin oxidase family protein [Mycobacterium noviomagense]ORB12980.1 hypothetical protein BST37_14795 [Mycobacterium noviomagense]BBY05385.1 hypothetical protein MNVI_07030 [Mycobacterium noviomagense]